MLIPSDPKKAWNDRVSPTSPSSIIGDVVPIAKTARHTREDGDDSPVRVDDKAEDDAFTQSPPPLPSMNGPTTLAELGRYPLRLVTRSSPDEDDAQQHDTSVNDTTTAEELFPRTPTPTSDQFREMLESYTEIPAPTIPQLLELAERLTAARVEAAREEQRIIWHAIEPLEEFEEAEGVKAVTAEMEALFHRHTGLVEGEVERLVLMAQRTGDSRVDAARVEVRDGFLRGLEEEGFPEEDGVAVASSPPSSPAMTEEERAERLARRLELADLRAEGMSARVHVRLLPARIALLQGCEEGDGDQLPRVELARKVARWAYAALGLARELGEEAAARAAGVDGERGADEREDERWEGNGVEAKMARALQGRCAYYVAISEWMLAQHLAVGRERDGDGEGQAVVLQYFELARQAAEGGFHEGEWAREWLGILTEQKSVESAEGEGKEADGEGKKTSWVG